MEHSVERSLGEFTSRRSPWFRLLQIVGQMRKPGQTDSRSEPSETGRSKTASDDEAERLKKQIIESGFKVCPNKVQDTANRILEGLLQGHLL